MMIVGLGGKLQAVPCMHQTINEILYSPGTKFLMLYLSQWFQNYTILIFPISLVNVPFQYIYTKR